MLEFFIALFGGLFYGIKIHEDKKQSKIADERFNKTFGDMKSDFDRWIVKVVDEKLEDEIDDLVCNLQNRQNIYDTIAPSLSGFLPEIKNFDDFSHSVYNNSRVLKFILMAQNGKIPKDEAECGIRSPGVYDEKERKKWMYFHTVMLIVNNELIRNGVEPMVFSRGDEISHIQFNANARSYAIPIAQVYSPIGGKYYWWSCRLHVY